MRKYKAFTLAEVLLVLAIIGVIAAVTIPATMQQSAEKKYAALAKKAVSSLQNAIDLKLTYVPLNAAQMNMHLFQWLADGEEFGFDTLKVVKHNANWSVVQTADGTIYYVKSESNNSSNPTGKSVTLRIDVNGSEGPTKSTVENGLTDYVNDKKHHDIIYMGLYGTNQLKIPTNSDAENDRARRYLGIDY